MQWGNRKAFGVGVPGIPCVPVPQDIAERPVALLTDWVSNSDEENILKNVF